jgi:hypothetical protein
MKAKPIVRDRNAKTGEFEKTGYSKTHPRTAIRDVMPRKKR